MLSKSSAFELTLQFSEPCSAGKEPAILSGIGNVTTSAGKDVKLECDVSFGKPKAEVVW